MHHTILTHPLTSSVLCPYINPTHCSYYRHPALGDKPRCSRLCVLFVWLPSSHVQSLALYSVFDKISIIPRMKLGWVSPTLQPFNSASHPCVVSMREDGETTPHQTQAQTGIQLTIRLVLEVRLMQDPTDDSHGSHPPYLKTNPTG
jgi:hypothetical protein